MGVPPYIDYIAKESIPKLIDDLKREGVSLCPIRGSMDEVDLDDEWICKWRRATRWMSFAVDPKVPGYFFVLIAREPWYWWFLRRKEHCYLDEALSTAVARYSQQITVAKSN